MNDRPDKAAPQHGARTTIKLLSPITRGVPSPVTEITVREPLLSDRAEAERRYSKNPVRMAIFLTARLAGLPEEAAGSIKTRDANRIQRWLRSLDPVDLDEWRDEELDKAARLLDLVNDDTDLGDDPRARLMELLEPNIDEARSISSLVRDVDLSSPRTFELAVPVPLDEGELTEITLDEPDLESAVVAGKFETEAEQLAAMIAHIGGITIPVAMRLAGRDTRDFEAYIGGFSNAPDDFDPAPQTKKKSATRKARTAGAT